MAIHSSRDSSEGKMDRRIRLRWFFSNTIIRPVSSASGRKTEKAFPIRVLLHDSIPKKQPSQPDTGSLPFVSLLLLSHALSPPVAPSGLLLPTAQRVPDKHSAESDSSTCAALGIDGWAKDTRTSREAFPSAHLMKLFSIVCIHRLHCFEWRWWWCNSIKLYWFLLC